MSSYVFDNAREAGTERLSHLERVSDPTSIASLQKLGIAPGWRCLEIGGGKGSIASWLADQVGDSGKVVVTDINPRFVDGLATIRSNVEVIRHDIVRDALAERSFDLIHARHVLLHLPDSPALLPKLKAALKPGGWLVIEDFDPLIDRTVLIGDRAKAEALQRVGDAIFKLIAKHGGAGTGWGRQLPALFRDLGLRDITVDVAYHCSMPRSPFAELHRIAFARTRAEGVAAGFASEQDYDIAIALMEDPATLYYSNPVFTACGRRPPT
jgi:SAM-dependent methyltransferase